MMKFSMSKWRDRVIAGLRSRLRDGAERVRRAAGPVLVASVAAVLAFSVSKYGLGHPLPFFAPVAAWICLGFTKNRDPLAVGELAAGAVLGVATAEVMMLVTGSGIWQTGVVLIIAALGARLTARGNLFTIQAGVNAMVAMAMGPAAGSAPVSRVLDALVGGGVALIVAFAWPRDVTKRPRKYVRAAQAELTSALNRLADGLERGDADRLGAASRSLQRARGGIEDANAVVTAAFGVIKVNPLTRRHRPRVVELRRQLRLAQRTANAVELLIRQAPGAIAETGSDAQTADIVRGAGDVLSAVRAAMCEWASPEPARRAAAALAAECAPGDVSEGGWRPTALVSIMRSIIVDLLQMTGLSRGQARELLPDLSDVHVDVSGQEAADGPSDLWGQASADRA